MTTPPAAEYTADELEVADILCNMEDIILRNNSRMAATNSSSSSGTQITNSTTSNHHHNNNNSIDFPQWRGKRSRSKLDDSPSSSKPEANNVASPSTPLSFHPSDDSDEQEYQQQQVLQLEQQPQQRPRLSKKRKISVSVKKEELEKVVEQKLEVRGMYTEEIERLQGNVKELKAVNAELKARKLKYSKERQGNNTGDEVIAVNDHVHGGPSTTTQHPHSQPLIPYQHDEPVSNLTVKDESQHTFDLNLPASVGPEELETGSPPSTSPYQPLDQNSMIRQSQPYDPRACYGTPATFMYQHPQRMMYQQPGPGALARQRRVQLNKMKKMTRVTIVK